MRGKDAGSTHIEKIWVRLRTQPRAAQRGLATQLPCWNELLACKGVALVLEDLEFVLLERLGDGLARVVDPLLVR
jgi:hypothetical protein